MPDLIPSQMQFATINGITFHYARRGQQEGPALVFVNTLGADWRIWDDVTSHFVDSFQVIGYDKRGHGLSDSPPGPYSIRDHTQDLAGLLATLNVGEAILVGVSVGGMIALDFAASYPQRARALILCDTAAKIGNLDYWAERIGAIETKGMAQMARTILPRWFAPSFAEQQPAVYQGYYNMLSRAPVNGYIATCAAIRDADLTPSLASIQTKSLVLCGAEDQATAPEIVRTLAAALPNAEFDLIEDAGHTPSVEQPAAVAARIKRFLQDNGYV